MFILILLILKNRTLSKPSKTKIIITSVLIMICALSECAGVLMDGSDPSLRSLHIMIKFFEFSLTPIIPVVFANAFYTVKKRFAAFIPAALHLVLELFSVFFGLTFYVDSQNIYHHGRLYFVYYLAILSGIIFLIFTAIRFGKQYQNRNRISLEMILLFVFFGTACQIIDSSIKIVWLTVAIGMILYYIYYCNMILQLDPLTGLLNRRAYDARVLSERRNCAVLVFDIDNFKSINDRYGHGFGDVCLRTVGDVIKTNYGKSGLCYRIGGDEFCVVTDRRADVEEVNRMNIEFENALSEKRKTENRLPTVAVGCAVYEPSETSFKEAAFRADKQMYLNKKTKGDRGTKDTVVS